MKLHEGQFIKPYAELIDLIEETSEELGLEGEVIETVIYFPYIIGYADVCATDDWHEIVYAKRRDSDVYTRFTLDGEMTKTNKCVICLEQSEEEEQYIIKAMFTGEYAIKEAKEENKRTVNRRIDIKRFWNYHALAFDAKTIDLETVTYKYPHYEEGVTEEDMENIMCLFNGRLFSESTDFKEQILSEIWEMDRHLFNKLEGNPEEYFKEMKNKIDEFWAY